MNVLYMKFTFDEAPNIEDLFTDNVVILKVLLYILYYTFHYCIVIGIQVWTSYGINRNTGKIESYTVLLKMIV